VFGTFSGFYFFLNPRNEPLVASRFDPFARDFLDLVRNPPGLVQKLRLAVLLSGIDMGGRPGGVVSAAHGDAELEATVSALRSAIALLRADGDLPSA
jgi:glutamate-1-semialdehyde 2,1-aminomutase